MSLLVEVSRIYSFAIVNGSGFEPTFYIIFESDLKVVWNFKIVYKYDDYTNLLQPGRSAL